MARESFFDQLYKGLADAVQDIREKVVEEPYFGRALTERESPAPQWPEANQQQALGSSEHSIERNPPDMDMDR